MNSIQLNASRVAGPSIAALLALWGISTAQIFVINAATYLFLIVALTRVVLPDIRGQHPERGWRRMLTGLRISRERGVLARLLLAMTGFSFFSLAFVALFPSVARINFGVDPLGSTYRWLYATWGLGAFFGALSTGTVLASVHRPMVIRRGLIGFSICLAGFALMHSPAPAFPIGFCLGVFYFMAANSMATVFQQNLKDDERVTMMPLWFMAFGGTVAVSGLAAGPIIDVIGTQSVLLFGAAFALFLSWWSDLDRLSSNSFLSQP